MENNDTIKQIFDSVRPCLEILETFASSGDGDIKEVNQAFEEAYKAAKDVQVLLKEEIGDIPEAMGFSGCQATGEDWSNTDWSDIDEFLSCAPAIRFTAPQKYAEYTMKLNGFFITVQQQMKCPEDAKEDIPSNVSLLKVQVIQHDIGSCKTIGFSNYVAITEKEAEIIKSIELEKGRPVFNYDLRNDHHDLGQKISTQVLGSDKEREERESLGMYLSYTFFSDNYVLGEQILLDFEGTDGSSYSEGSVIFIDSDHVIAQIHFLSPGGVMGFNRRGISYEDVKKITGTDFPHSEFDRFIDILDESTLEHTIEEEI